MSKQLTEQDYINAANKLRCEVSAVKAVAEVESRGKAYYADGFPVILYERHVFRKYTKGKYNTTYPVLSGARGNYGAGGQHQRNKFNQAFALNPNAAMKSCSWGRFQIMGFNHEVCGYNTVAEFVDAMKESEGKQLDAFVNFVIGNNLADELRRKDWAKFAFGYNGAGYAQNAYDVKMAKAYKKYLKTSAVTHSIPPVAEPAPESASSANISPSSSTDQPTTELPPNNTQTVKAPESEGSTTTQATLTIGGFAVPTFLVAIFGVIKSTIEAGYFSAAQVGEIVLRFLTENTKYFFLLIGLIIVGLILKKLYKQISFFLQMWFAASKDLNNVEVKKQ